MSGNGGGKCSGVMITVSGMAVTNVRGGTKGACRHVSTPTLKSVMEQKECLESVVKIESYLEGEAMPPLYSRVWGITSCGFRSVSLGMVRGHM